LSAHCFLLQALHHAPQRSIALTVGFGFLWGIGSILFGAAVKMVGNSLAFRSDVDFFLARCHPKLNITSALFSAHALPLGPYFPS
jgi:hypothetical protein